MRANILIMLALAFSVTARAQSSGTWRLEPFRPSIALSASSDGALSGKVSGNLVWDGVYSASVHTLTVSPTFTASDRANAPLFSIDTKSDRPDFGTTISRAVSSSRTPTRPWRTTSSSSSSRGSTTAA